MYYCYYSFGKGKLRDNEFSFGDAEFDMPRREIHGADVDRDLATCSLDDLQLVRKQGWRSMAPRGNRELLSLLKCFQMFELISQMFIYFRGKK